MAFSFESFVLWTLLADQAQLILIMHAPKRVCMTSGTTQFTQLHGSPAVHAVLPRYHGLVACVHQQAFLQCKTHIKAALTLPQLACSLAVIVSMA